jgi:hypothetical protein
VLGSSLPACKVCSAGFTSAGGLLSIKPTYKVCPGNTTTLGVNRVRCNGE